MRLGEILKQAATYSNSPFGSVIKSLIPGAGIAGGVLEAVAAAVGGPVDGVPVKTVIEKVNALAPAERAELELKEIDLQIVESNNYAAVAMAQEQSNNTTRPAIAMKMADLYIQLATASFLLAGLALILDAVLSTMGKETFALSLAMDGLPWIAAAYAVPAMEIIRQYFAKRSDDKRTAVAATGVTVPPVAGLFGSLAAMIKR